MEEALAPAPAPAAAGAADDREVMVVAPDAIDRLWPILAPYIQRGLDYGFDAYELDECRRRLRGAPGAQPRLVAVCIMAPGEQLPLAVLTLELSTVQGIGRVCHYVTAGGAEMETWAAWLDPIMVRVAAEQGAEYLTTKGRPGWARALRPLGYQHLYTICGKKVTP